MTVGDGVGMVLGWCWDGVGMVLGWTWEGVPSRSGQEFRNRLAQRFDGKGLPNDRIHRLVRIIELFQIGGDHQNRQGRGNSPDV